jgi:hypothetical protein
MINPVNTIYFYFLLPIYLSLAFLTIFYNIPSDYYYGIICFYAIITVPVLLVGVLISFKIPITNSYIYIITSPRYKCISLCLCIVIFIFGPIDIYINGFKLLHPATYADLSGIGRYVRHITILCWILIPVAFIFVKSGWAKIYFIGYALLFPIIIIDRNRFLISCYSLFFCTTGRYDFLKLGRSKKINYFYGGGMVLFCILIFAITGYFRSGDAFMVPSSGNTLSEGFFPLSELFMELPGLVQQIILYITTPIFNFATVVANDFINQDFLLKQLSPFSREIFDNYPYAPVLVARFNVGTEFYPFLLYGGFSFVFGAFIMLLISFLLSVYLFKTYPSIFTFLIFIRISYNVLFMGFAPQFYILLNFMFVLLMLLLFFFAELIQWQGEEYFAVDIYDI